MEESLKEWVEAEQARTAYHLGRREEAARLATNLKDDFHREFARKLAARPKPRSVCIWTCPLCGSISRPVPRRPWLPWALGSCRPST